MYFLLLFLLFALIAGLAPRTWRAIELLFIAPIIGIAFGGLVWAVSAMFCAALITWPAFGTFLSGGTLLSVLTCLKVR